MRSSPAKRQGSWCVLAAGMALAAVSAFHARATECRITEKVPDDIAVAAAPDLHAAPDFEPARSQGESPSPALPHRGSHGQIVLGKEAPRFLYHLPIFMADPWSHPHNFQVILAVSPAGGGDAPAAAYAQDRAQHPDALYTAVPPVFDQLALVSDHAGGGLLRRFDDVALFRNHFERSDRHLVSEDADLAVERVIYFAEFNPHAQPAATLVYVLFGRGDDRFMAHLLSGPPDFDQILEVAVEGEASPAEHLEHGVFVSFNGRSNTVEERLVQGDAVTCTVAGAPSGATPEVTLRVVADRYCEVGEVSHAVGEVVGRGFGRARSCPRE